MTLKDNYETSRKGTRTAFDVFLGLISLVYGVGILTASVHLLAQCVQNHKKYARENSIEEEDEQNENSSWKNSEIPLMVVTTFGILLGLFQMIAALVFIYADGKFRIFGVISFTGSGIIIFVLNIIDLSLAISMKAHEMKRRANESAHFHPQWTNLEIPRKFMHNPEGHVFCTLLATNSIFVLIAVSLTSPKLYHYRDQPFDIPQSTY